MNLLVSPPSLYRGLACLIGFLGTFMANRVFLLLGGLLIVLVFMSIQGKLREFGRFGLTVLVPIGAVLIIIWGFVRKSGPSGEDYSQEDGILFAIRTILRLALLGAIFLATVLTLSPDRLSHLLYTFGIRGWALAGIISCLNLWSDFRRNTKQIYASRCARGLMPDRSFITRLRQLPYTLRTLFISSLMYSLDRAQTWESGGLIYRLEQLNKRTSETENSFQFSGILLLGLSLAWAIIAAVYFFKSE